MSAEPRPPRLPRPAAAAGGFTLLEVIVALAIAGIAFVALFRAGGTGMFAVDTAARVEEAVERAQSHLAAVGRAAPLLQGDFNGDDGGGFQWWLSIHPAAVRRIGAEGGRAQAAVVTLYEVRVAISWAGNGRRRQVVLRSERLETVTAPTG